MVRERLQDRYARESVFADINDEVNCSDYILVCY